MIYDCKVWDIAKMNESDGTYTIQANYGVNSLDISIGSEQDGKRTISIGGNSMNAASSTTAGIYPIIQRRTPALRLQTTTMPKMTV